MVDSTVLGQEVILPCFKKLQLKVILNKNKE